MVSIYLKTFGCSLNKFDSDVMKYYLKREGFKICEKIDNVHVIIINSCGVKKQTEDRIISYIKKLRRRFGDEKKIILTGCLPLINYKRIVKEIKVNAMLGPSPGRSIIKAVESVLNGEYYEFLSKNIDISTPILYSSSNEITKPVGIASGCLDRCSFCGTRNARGTLVSRPIKDIIRLIRNYIRSGVKEIYLTSLDNGAYGYDLKPRRNLIDLLREIDSIDGSFIVRIGMMNPRWAYKYLNDLIEIFRISKKFYYFLHIPVQSGSEKVLKIMNRSHGVEEYIESIKKLRKEVDKRFTIMTDVIVGHPGESDEDFQETINLMKESQPDFVNISQFFPRPNTLSASMKKIPTDIVKRRSVELSRIVDEIMLKRNRMWLDWNGAILLDEEGKFNRFIGRNYAYKIFAVDGNNLSRGEVIYVKVVQAYTTWLYGEFHRKASSLYELWKLS